MSGYRVLARRFRPQGFGELVGQTHVATALANAVASDRLAHAYIFAGLRGTGKTTVARILAKCLNCESGPTREPCGTCVSCTEIAASRSMDVLEIDAASRTKVEQTREMLEIVSYAPVRDRNKILIIDEAHMLSKSSFNALLKTLEEPPPNVLFVLATTELHKILPTIVSRCQVFEFRRVAVPEVAGHLRRICDEGGVEISDSALERIARAGEGSVRDSLSSLERILAFCGDRVEDDDVLRMLGAVRTRVLVDWVEGLAERDAGKMIHVLDRLVDEGHDLVHFWNEVLSALRDLLLAETLGDAGDLLARPADEAAALQEAAGPLGREDLTRAFQIVAELESPLKTSSQPRYLFEAALVRLAALGTVRPIEELLAGLPAGGAGPAPRPTSSAPATPSAPPRAQKKNARREAASPTEELIAACRAERPMLAALLDQAVRLRLQSTGLDVVFPVDMDALKKKCEQDDSRELLGRIAEQLLGHTVPVKIELDGEGDPEPVRQRRGAPEPGPEGPEAGGRGELARAVESDPAVRRVLSVFGAQIVEIGSAGPPPGSDAMLEDPQEDNE